MSEENETLEYVLRSGFLNYFVFEYLDDNRLKFDDVKADDFMNNFEVDNELLNSFIDYSRLRETNFNISGYEEMIKRYIKATLAQQLYSQDYFQQIINKNDPMIQKALELKIED